MSSDSRAAGPEKQAPWPWRRALVVWLALSAAGGTFVAVSFTRARARINAIREGMTRDEVERALDQRPFWVGTDQGQLRERAGGLSFKVPPLAGSCAPGKSVRGRLRFDEVRLAGGSAALFRLNLFMLSALVYFDEAGRVACVLEGST